MPIIAVDCDKKLQQKLQQKLQLPIMFPPHTSIETKNGVHTVFKFSGLRLKPYIVEKRDDGYYWKQDDYTGIHLGLHVGSQGPHKNVGLAVIAFNRFYRGK